MIDEQLNQFNEEAEKELREIEIENEIEVMEGSGENEDEEQIEGEGDEGEKEEEDGDNQEYQGDELGCGSISEKYKHEGAHPNPLHPSRYALESTEYASKPQEADEEVDEEADEEVDEEVDDEEQDEQYGGDQFESLREARDILSRVRESTREELREDEPVYDEHQEQPGEDQEAEGDNDNDGEGEGDASGDREEEVREGEPDADPGLAEAGAHSSPRSHQPAEEQAHRGDLLAGRPDVGETSEPMHGFSPSFKVPPFGGRAGEEEHERVLDSRSTGLPDRGDWGEAVRAGGSSHGDGRSSAYPMSAQTPAQNYGPGPGRRGQFSAGPPRSANQGEELVFRLNSELQRLALK